MLEFNFEEDKRDLRIRGDNQVMGTVGAAGRKFQRQRVNQDPTTDIPLDYSLRVCIKIKKGKMEREREREREKKRKKRKKKKEKERKKIKSILGYPATDIPLDCFIS
jgi:hypothetical protein